jgi:LruC domain-containing protein
MLMSRHWLRIALSLLVIGNIPGFTCAGTTYFPGQGEFGTLLFEDLWPTEGDFDFNDVVLRYNYATNHDGFGAVTSIDATYQLGALGTLMNDSLVLHLPVPQSTPLNATVTIGSSIQPVAAEPDESDVVLVVSDLRSDLCGGAPGFINTDPAVPYVSIPAVQLHIDFAAPQLVPSDEPYDLFIMRTGDRSHQVHLPQYPGIDAENQALFGTGIDDSDPPPSLGGTSWYHTADGVPFALNIPTELDNPLHPDLWAVPSERTPIADAYPDFLSFISSGGTASTDWYLYPNPEHLYAPVPEPSTFVLIAPAVLGLAAVARRRVRRSNG